MPGISEEAKHLLQNYNWPGNIRELRNVIERAMNDAWMEVLTWKHFEPYFKSRHPHFAVRTETPSADSTILTIQEAKEKAETDAIKAAMAAAGNNKTQAARLLGITRAMLYRKLDNMNLN